MSTSYSVHSVGSYMQAMECMVATAQEFELSSKDMETPVFDDEIEDQRIQSKGKLAYHFISGSQ